jgi:hypothetical protein
MIVPAAILLVGAAAPESSARADPAAPRAAQLALGSASEHGTLMWVGVCGDPRRKAEIGQLNSEYHRLVRLLAQRYGLHPYSDTLIITDTDCGKSEEYPQWRRAYQGDLIVARRLLEREDR